jgi:hypothetical protein
MHRKDAIKDGYTLVMPSKSRTEKRHWGSKGSKNQQKKENDVGHIF